MTVVSHENELMACPPSLILVTFSSCSKKRRIKRWGDADGGGSGGRGSLELSGSLGPTLVISKILES